MRKGKHLQVHSNEIFSCFFSFFSFFFFFVFFFCFVCLFFLGFFWWWCFFCFFFLSFFFFSYLNRWLQCHLFTKMEIPWQHFLNLQSPITVFVSQLIFINLSYFMLCMFLLEWHVKKQLATIFRVFCIDWKLNLWPVCKVNSLPTVLFGSLDSDTIQLWN